MKAIKTIKAMRCILSGRGFKGALAAAALLPGWAAAGEVSVDYQPGAIFWNTPPGYAAELSVGGPTALNMMFEPGGMPEFLPVGEDGAALPDGFYTYQITLIPEEVAADREAMAAARVAGDREAYARLAARVQEGGDYAYLTDSGAFTIDNGSISEYDAEREDAAARAAYEAAEADSPEEESVENY